MWGAQFDGDPIFYVSRDTNTHANSSTADAFHIRLISDTLMKMYINECKVNNRQPQ